DWNPACCESWSPISRAAVSSVDVPRSFSRQMLTWAYMQRSYGVSGLAPPRRGCAQPRGSDPHSPGQAYPEGTHFMTTVTASRPTAPLHAPVNIGTAAPTGGVLGLLPELSRDALGLFMRCTRDYGDFVRIRLGITRAIVIGHPDLVEEVLVTRNH